MCADHNSHVFPSKEPCDPADLGLSSEQYTSNGAPSKAIFEEVIQWSMIQAESGKVPIQRLDNFVSFAKSDGF